MRHFLLVFACLANVGYTFATTLSETNRGLYLAVAGWGLEPPRGFVGDPKIRFDDRLLWRPFCNTGLVELNYPDRAYGIRLKLTSPDGKDVRKTKLGESVGSKFDDLHSYEDVAHSWSLGSVTAQGPCRGEFSGPWFPAPRELFQMEKSGTYTLQLEMQMFRIVVNNSNKWERQLIRFSPMKIRVEKPFDGAR